MSVHSPPHVHWGKVTNGDVKIKTSSSPSTSFEWKELIKAPHTHTHTRVATAFGSLCSRPLCWRGPDGERERDRLTETERTLRRRAITLKHATVIYSDAAVHFIRSTGRMWTLHTYTRPLLNPDTDRHYPDAAAARDINHGLSTSLPLLFLPLSVFASPFQCVFWHDR